MLVTSLKESVNSGCRFVFSGSDTKVVSDVKEWISNPSNVGA